jgi:NADPH:quinone reductase and related Zn-dependent oxidoreductases
VIAAGVNPVDDASRSPKYAKFFGITLPFIPGYDIAGVVEELERKSRDSKRATQFTRTLA